MTNNDTEAFRTIGPFRILNEIGRGAMGVVYRAYDPAIGRELAVKILYVPRFAEENQVAEAKQRFVVEAQAAGRLSHPNIVVIYQFGHEEDYQYLAMELVPGSSLDKLMTAAAVWSPAEISSIIGQAASALDYAHSNQVVHRDVKPANIMLRPDGVVKVTDFGIARVSEQVLTVAGSWGTPIYMAPERLSGDRGDGRADQYALAVVAYEMLTNRLPFGQTENHALLLEILQKEPGKLPDPAQDAVLRRALAKDPEQRFASCSEFARELAKSLVEFATTRTAMPPPVSQNAPSRSRKWLLLLLLLLAAAGAAFVLYSGRLQSRAPAVPAATGGIPREGAPAVHVPVRKPAVLLESPMASRSFLKKMFGREKGPVRFRAVVGTDGRLGEFVLLSGPKSLEPAARKAAEQWKYQAATVDGEPVDQTVEITIEFRN